MESSQVFLWIRGSLNHGSESTAQKTQSLLLGKRSRAGESGGGGIWWTAHIPFLQVLKQISYNHHINIILKKVCFTKSIPKPSRTRVEKSKYQTEYRKSPNQQQFQLKTPSKKTRSRQVFAGVALQGQPSPGWPLRGEGASEKVGITLGK